MYYFRELKQTKNNMEFKGTKGPWIIDNKESKFETDISANGIRVAQAKHYNYGKDGWTMNDPVHSEGKANALLISKAPEMLEMLKKCSNTLNDIYQCDVTEIQKLIKEATTI